MSSPSKNIRAAKDEYILKNRLYKSCQVLTQLHAFSDMLESKLIPWGRGKPFYRHFMSYSIARQTLALLQSIDFAIDPSLRGTPNTQGDTLIHFHFRYCTVYVYFTTNHC